MKTIEDKAKAYAKNNGTVPVFYKPDVKVDISKQVERAYLAGATEALAGQWRKDDDIEGLQDGEQVIVAIQRMDNSIKYFYAAYFQNGKFWYDSDDTEIYSFNLWMRLPEPPKDESE